MKINTEELDEKVILKDSPKKKEKEEKTIERRYHPRLDGFFTDEEAQKEIENRAKTLSQKQ